MLSAELGRDLKVRSADYVDSSFPTLIDDLKADRCDVAMFAVGMLPQRMQHLKFSRPYLQSDIYGVTTAATGWCAAGPTSTSPACRWRCRPAPSWSR
jgi:cyclohexadienyl dehydratase